jgi:hypothetical protein
MIQSHVIGPGVSPGPLRCSKTSPHPIFHNKMTMADGPGSIPGRLHFTSISGRTWENSNE